MLKHCFPGFPTVANLSECGSVRESLHSVREQGREGRDSPRAPPRAKGVGERCEYNPLVGTRELNRG